MVNPLSQRPRGNITEQVEMAEGARVPEMQNASKAASDFEALLLNQMLKSMQQSVPKDGLLSSNDEAIYQDMFNDALAQSIARGQGIGIKQVILRELDRGRVGDK